MKKLSLLAIFLVVSCSSIPKTTIPNHKIQLTCEMGSRYFFINLQDVPKKTGVISTTMELVSDNAWYIMSLTTMPDFNQKPSVTWGPADENEKRFLQKPYSVTNDMIYFTTYGLIWEVNRINMQTIAFQRMNKNNVVVGTCEYGFQTKQFK